MSKQLDYFEEVTNEVVKLFQQQAVNLSICENDVKLNLELREEAELLFEWLNLMAEPPDNETTKELAKEVWKKYVEGN